MRCGAGSTRKFIIIFYLFRSICVYIRCFFFVLLAAGFCERARTRVCVIYFWLRSRVRAELRKKKNQIAHTIVSKWRARFKTKMYECVDEEHIGVRSTRTLSIYGCGGKKRVKTQRCRKGHRRYEAAAADEKEQVQHTHVKLSVRKRRVGWQPPLFSVIIMIGV